MKTTLNRIFSILALAVLTIVSLTPAAAGAQTKATSGQALEIAPPLIYLKADPGKTVKTQVLIRDVSPVPLNVTGEVNDFVASGENGSPKVLLNEASPDPYSMKTWVVPLPTLTLQPKQIKTLPITINVPADASPGGHYGVFRFTASAPSVNGGNGVALSASIGALVLLTVSGNVHENLTVQQFAVTKDGKPGSFFESAPLAFFERIKNNGNVHEQPQGTIKITDMFGRTLANLPVNQPPGNILPGSIRRFDQPLDKSVIGNKRLFGRYTAHLSLNYGSNKQTLNDTISFWVLPIKTIAIVIGVIIAGFFGLRYGIRRYNRRVVERANRGGPQRRR